ncbi:MAG: M48 family metallopeptidase [Candidatus Sericytochromatia bacterium]|nr:M48 family metallopeptidase [Candidatus Sericytochromatia bacterium]
MTKQATASWEARVFDGETAKPQPVLLTITSRGLALEWPDGRQALWPYPELDLLQGRLPGEHVRLQWRRQGPSPSVVLRDQAFLSSLEALAPAARFGRPHPARQLTRHALAALGLTFGLYLLAWRVLLPILTDRVAETVPRRWETALGQAVVGDLEREHPVCPVRAKQQALNRLMRQLSGGSRYPYRVVLVHGDTVNALAAPGGQIVVFERLWSAMPTPEAMLGILSHEMEHVEKRHTTRAIMRQMAGQLLLSGLTGDAAGFGQLVGLSQSLDQLAHSRAAEQEADQAGAQRLAASGVDPNSLRLALAALSQEESVRRGESASLRLLSSHPELADRMRQLDARWRGHRPARVPALYDAHAWQRLRVACTGH